MFLLYLQSFKNCQMNNNRKLLVYGAACAVLLIVVISVFFAKLFSSSGDGNDADYSVSEVNLCKAVPSDAVLVLDIKELGTIGDIVEDTASFSYKFIADGEPLTLMQRKMAADSGFDKLPAIYSLHYSAKNDVSFFSAIDISSADIGNGDLAQYFTYLGKRKKKYNNTPIYTFKDSLYVARYGKMILMSTSSYLLESSIRHLDNGTSIYDNAEFESLYKRNCNKKVLYVNHHQIGKFFSGVMERAFLKYSDFVMRFASWSCFSVSSENGHLGMVGVMENWNEEKYQSSVLCGQVSDKSGMGTILPAETIFAASVILSDVPAYIDSYKLFLEVHKKLSGYEYGKKIVEIEGGQTPDEYIDSLKVEELVSAYCRFGDRYEWLSFVKEKSSVGLSDVVSSVLDQDKKIPVEPYEYKGYLAALFGGIFSHCNEEAFCRVGGWQVIGPKDIVSDFASGGATYFDLKQYLKQTPLADFLDRKGSVKIVANLKMGQDSIMQVVKPYYKQAIGRSLDNNNFEYLSVNISNDNSTILADVDFYAATLGRLPQPRPQEKADVPVYIDSTIVLDKGPFELVDFVKGGKCYLEQAPNLKLRLLDGKRKGVWTIPFSTPICGSVVQVDFFKNNKLQMLFASENRLYLLDRLGRMVRGFPVTLPDSVVLGPVLLDLENGKNYRFMVLNADNSIAIYPLTKDNIKESVKIKAPEFVKELPELKVINGKKYLFLRTVSQYRIYDMAGKEIVVKDKKRKISPQSEIMEVGGDQIKVKGTDGKGFILDLLSGKTKKE